MPEGAPQGWGDCCVQEAEPQREEGGAGGPCLDSACPEFLGPRPPVCGQAWLVPNLREEEKLSRGQPICDPGSERPGELGEGSRRCGWGLGSWYIIILCKLRPQTLGLSSGPELSILYVPV